MKFNETPMYIYLNSCNFSAVKKTLQFLLVERSWLGDLQGMPGEVDATLNIPDVTSRRWQDVDEAKYCPTTSYSPKATRGSTPTRTPTKNLNHIID